MKRSDAIEAGKRLAQTPQVAGLQLLLSDPEDYYLAHAQALAKFNADRPNIVTVDYTVTTAGFRYIVGGPGAVIAGWVDGRSYITDIWAPYVSTFQGVEPNERNAWRIVRSPGGVSSLELVDTSLVVGDVLRLDIVTPYVVSDEDDADTTIPAGYHEAFQVLVAYWILTMAANKAVQNTGSSSLPGDIVNRQSQSTDFRNRAKDLLGIYVGLVGGGAGTDQGGASAFKDLDVRSGFATGFLWHGSRGR